MTFASDKMLELQALIHMPEYRNNEYVAAAADLADMDSRIPAILAAIGGLSVAPPESGYEDILRAYTNKQSKVFGRGPSQKEELELAEATLSCGSEFYLRPNGDKYYSRNWGIHEDVAVLRKAREVSHWAFLRSVPGTGKTALAEAAFADELQTVNGSGDTEVSDFIGGYVQTPTGFLWVDGPLLVAAETGGVLLVDEIGLISPKVLPVLYSFMDGRREYTVTANPERGTVKAAEGFFVVGTTNPDAPGVRLSEALLSRFLLHVEMTTDFELAEKLGVKPEMIVSAQNLATKVREEGLEWAPQFRELIAFRDLSEQYGEEFALANLVASAPEGCRPTVTSVLGRNFVSSKCLPAQIGYNPKANH